jgi:imidazolonepropionase
LREPNDVSPCEAVVYGFSCLLGEGVGPVGAAAEALAIGGGRILGLGRREALLAAHPRARRIALPGGLLAPGFVDAHVHPAFAVGRAAEFGMKCAGRGYQEIAAAGGGIRASARAVREAGAEEFALRVGKHFRRMQRHGTTACEAKSGYGLLPAEELKSLRAIRAAAQATGMEALPTFLGAHAVPEEFAGRADAFVDLLVAEALPAVKEEGLARAVDIFVEEGAFTLAQARRYLEAARSLGFALRVHADQFSALGGVELAVELGAESVDHLEALTDAGLEALALSGRTFAGLLPAVPHFLGLDADAPARRLLKAGVPCFVATDFNPGSCYTPSLPEAAHFARRRMGLTAAEAFHAVTAGAAASLGLGARKGRIAPGFDADLVLLDLPDLEHFGYAFGENPVLWAMSRGREFPAADPLSEGGTEFAISHG